MQSIADKIKIAAFEAIQTLFPDAVVQENDVVVNETNAGFDGDYTVVLFPFVKSLRKSPQELGDTLGEYIVANNELFTAYQIVKGFLNLTVSDGYLTTYLADIQKNKTIFRPEISPEKIMVEFSSPNTNKPLHFGHLRNNFLGASVSNILKTVGHQVTKANLVNDRGIHICKSMIAWQMFANGATPQSTGIKGDHLVGDYYVKFNDVYKVQMKELMDNGIDENTAEKEAPIFKEAQEMLRKWEAGDEAVRELWSTMNGWVFAGFDQTYAQLGITFDKVYYESNTYLLGKEMVTKGLEKGVFYKKENGSVWVDLTADGLDEKLLLRADGTSVYMTQDLGTAELKYDDFKIDKSIYVIADEQNYHMQVLKLILQKLGAPYADGIYHLSYGMVELPNGKMKSREGTVVDADDMIGEMIALAKSQTEAAGKTEGFTEAELAQLYKTIGLGALKFYLLRVEPKKKMIFNPKESIDLQGFTATFIQYAHARICSILRKVGEPKDQALPQLALQPLERTLLLLLEQYPTILQEAAQNYAPSVICNYAFKLAQTFNSFFDKHSIKNAETEQHQQLRLHIAQLTARILKDAMSQLGIDVPEKM